MRSSKIRVLHPVLHYPPVIGGIEQWVQNIAERQPQDIDSFVVTGRVKGCASKEQVKNCFVFRRSPIGLNSLHSSLVYVMTAAPFIFLNSFYIARKNKVDIFHCHGLIGSTMGYLLSKLTHTPFICTEQGLLDANRGIMYRATNFLRGIVYRSSVLCIASSKSVAEDFHKLGVRRVEIIPNGVDLNKFTNRREVISNQSEFTILSVGRLEKIKGHRYLIESLVDIKSVVPHARLVVVGDGSGRDRLEAQTRNLKLSDSVEFIGAVPHDQLSEFFARADIFVMPSLSEGFGITAIEAMAAGVPLVASRVGGLLDIIEDGKNGIFTEAKDSGGIARAVLSLYNNQDIARSLASNGVERAKEYSWDRVASEVGHLYKKFT